ncbi:hypothetical protein O0L34_g6710 [Tuta absoluta]|nr:hypothetical protein O0L34_g6710 [Tuta absoluta]
MGGRDESAADAPGSCASSALALMGVERGSVVAGGGAATPAGAGGAAAVNGTATRALEPPRKRPKLASDDSAPLRKRILEYKLLRLKSLRDRFTEQLSELYFLQAGGNMMDYAAWRKRPPAPQLVTFLEARRPPALAPPPPDPPPAPAAPTPAVAVAVAPTVPLAATGAASAGATAAAGAQEVVEKARQEAYVARRVAELSRAGLWAERRLPRVLEPPRPKAHWDYLLEEMAWLAQDFAIERKWKKQAAKKCARAVQKYFQDKAVAAQKAEKAQELQLKRIAAFAAKEIRIFWMNVEKLVEWKREKRVERARKEALDEQLSYIVDRTERYSRQLAANLAPPPAAAASPRRSRRGLQPPHDHSPPLSDYGPDADDSADDEDTIAEQERRERAEDTAAELAALQQDAELNLDELVRRYADPPPPHQPGAEDTATDTDTGTDTDTDDELSEDSDSSTSRPLEELVAPAAAAGEGAGEGEGGEKRVEACASLAAALQPTGTTLADTAVGTPVPRLLKHALREYQHVGLHWLATMHARRLNGILADEMGLGKTIQTIALLAHLALDAGDWGPHLVVAPTSVVLNWEMEFKKWCPAFKILTYYGTIKERKLKRVGWTKANSFHVCITSYKLVVQDHQSFRRKKWRYLILDEAQNIKNFKSQRWQMLLNFQTDRRLLLTGTPLQNSLLELWSLMHFLMPAVFASHSHFREWFADVAAAAEGAARNDALVRRLHEVCASHSHFREWFADVAAAAEGAARNDALVRRLHEVCASHSHFREWFADVAAAAEGAARNDALVRRLHEVCASHSHFREWFADVAAAAEGAARNDALVRRLHEVCASHSHFREWFADVAAAAEGAARNDALVRRLHEVCASHSHFREWFADVAAAAEGAARNDALVRRLHEVCASHSHFREWFADVAAAAEGAARNDALVRRLHEVCASHSHFREWFADVAAAAEGAARNDALVRRLHEVLRPFLLRRLKADVERQMPRKYEHVVMCRLAKRQRFLYDDFMARASTRDTLQQGNLLSVINVLMQLRKVCNHPDLFEPRPVVSPLSLPALRYAVPALALCGVQRAAAAAARLAGDLATLEASGAGAFAAHRTRHLAPPRRLLEELPAPPPAPAPAPAPPRPPPARLRLHLRLVPRAPQAAQGAAPPPIVASRPPPPSRAAAPAAAPAPAPATPAASRLCVRRAECLRRLARTNERRCWRLPLYGADLRAALHAGPAPGPAPAPLPHRTIDQVLADMEDVIDRFSVCWTAARAPAPVLVVGAGRARGEEAARGAGARAWRRRAARLEAALLPAARAALALLHAPAARQAVAFPHPRLLQYDCGKLQTLSRLLRRLKAGGHRVLIFTQMTRVLDVLEAFLSMHGHTYLRLDGATKVEARQPLVDRFNSDARVFAMILSTRSGGVGLNLTGADCVVFYDSDWNPTMDAQAQDRAHRIGQTRDVHVFRLVTAATVEENILRKADQKRKLGHLAIEDGHFTTSVLRQANIKELFGAENCTESSDTKENDEQKTGGAGAGAGQGGAGTAGQGGELETALAACEDEADALAARLARAEQRHDLAEFDETLPLDDDAADAHAPPPAPAHAPTAAAADTHDRTHAGEFAALMKQLTPIEKYAMRLVESSEAATEAERAALDDMRRQLRDWEDKRRALREPEPQPPAPPPPEPDPDVTYSREDGAKVRPRRRRAPPAPAPAPPPSPPPSPPAAPPAKAPRTRSRGTVHINLWTLDKAGGEPAAGGAGAGPGGRRRALRNGTLDTWLARTPRQPHDDDDNDNK